MSLDVDGIIDGMVSDVASLGHFDRVNTHEPKSAPGRGLTAALWVQRVRAVARVSGLSTTSAYLLFQLRIYSDMLQEPQDGIDPNVIKAVDAVINEYNGDFRLNGTVMHVDILGQHGSPLGAEAGYLKQDNRLYRIVDIALPMVVADVWTQEG
jgi:hypothetical protein